MKHLFIFNILSVCLLFAGIAVVSGSCRTFTPPPGETEAREYLGVKLTPIAKQNNNALKGTQYIDRSTYRLVLDGLVGNPLSLTYDDLLALPQESRLTDLNCVEGWKFTAKWTGPTLASIFEKAGVKPEATTVIFQTTDDPEGYTSLELSYIIEQNIIIALRLNDVTLPAERGFPFQVVAVGKFGYKWAKWVDRIELYAGEFRGYWEREGYSNDADINGPSFDF